MFTGFLVAICFASGLCELLTHQFSHLDMHPSPVLANMMLGLTLANTSSFKEELLRLFRTLETGIFTCFFVLAGAHLNVVDLRLAWPAATLFLLIRGVGMIGGGYIGSRLSNSTKKNAVHIGRMLMSQGAIAITLVILLKANPLFSDTAGLMVATVVAACIASEIIGPVLMGRSLKQTGEAHQDRARLIEFLQEEYIDPNVHADNKWDAIESLCYFMCRVHNIKEHPRQVLTAIREREESMPTGIGMGVAVPHAKINVGKDILGVLGRLDPPVDFGAEDGEAARIVVMIVTPEDQAQKHIQVIAAVSKMMSNETVRRAVFAADTAEKIHDIIDSEEVSTFNYFLET
jgi:mannitol/fructose-specific phosphotransferase system IIA component (Ntr-type)